MTASKDLIPLRDYLDDLSLNRLGNLIGIIVEILLHERMKELENAKLQSGQSIIRN